jgi:hypothetical protein
VRAHLLAGQHFHDGFVAGTVPELKAIHVQVLPYNQGLHCPHLQTRQGVLHPKHVLAGVLTDLVKEAADQLLLLDEFDVCQGVGR